MISYRLSMGLFEGQSNLLPPLHGRTTLKGCTLILEGLTGEELEASLEAISESLGGIPHEVRWMNVSRE